MTPLTRRGSLLWIWLIATILLDGLQFLLLPANKAWLLSLLLGLPTFGAAVAVPIEFVRIWTNRSQSMPIKLVMSIVMFVGLSAIVCLAGGAMLFSHCLGSS
jgi:hypothetical protein